MRPRNLSPDTVLRYNRKNLLPCHSWEAGRRARVDSMTGLAYVVSRRVLWSLEGFRTRRTKVTPIFSSFSMWAVLFTGPAGFSYVSGVC